MTIRTVARSSRATTASIYANDDSRRQLRHHAVGSSAILGAGIMGDGDRVALTNAGTIVGGQGRLA
jgi:hypothetical protein